MRHKLEYVSEVRPRDDRYVPPMRSVEDQVDDLIRNLQPTPLAEQRRSAVFQYVRGVVKSRLPSCQVVSVGSFPLKTYLPCADVDMVVFLPRNTGSACPDAVDSEGSGQHTHTAGRYLTDGENRNSPKPDVGTPALVAINQALCTVAAKRGRKRGPDTQSRFPPASQMRWTPEIRNVSFVNARTPMVTMLVGNVLVDVTENQGGSVAASLLIEDADRLIGRNHLFKRSLLLLKAWALCETPRLVGQRVLGAREGGLTSYGLAVMVLHLFSSKSSADTLLHPLDVLISFFRVFADFDWARHCLTVYEPVTFDDNDRIRDPQSASKSRSRLWPIVKRTLARLSPTASEKTVRARKPRSNRYGRKSDGHEATARGSAAGVVVDSAHFPKRNCNIQDPLNPLNNLGHSVNKQGLKALKFALHEGRRQLTEVQLESPAVSRFSPSQSEEERRRSNRPEQGRAGPAQGGSNGWASAESDRARIEREAGRHIQGPNSPVQSPAPLATPISGPPAVSSPLYGQVPFFRFPQVPPLNPGFLLGSAVGVSPPALHHVVAYEGQQYFLGHPQSIVQPASPMYQFVFHPYVIPEGRVATPSLQVAGGPGQANPHGVPLFPSPGMQRSSSEPVFMSEPHGLGGADMVGMGHAEQRERAELAARPHTRPWTGAEPTGVNSSSGGRPALDDRGAAVRERCQKRQMSQVGKDQRHQTTSSPILPWNLPTFVSSSPASSTASMSEVAEDGGKDEQECHPPCGNGIDDHPQRQYLGVAQQAGPSWPVEEKSIHPPPSGSDNRAGRSGKAEKRRATGHRNGGVDIPTSGSSLWANWFLRDFFPHCCQLYGAGNGFREDLLDHPCQHWGNDVRPEEVERPAGTPDVLTGSSEITHALESVARLVWRVPEQATGQSSGSRGVEGQLRDGGTALTAEQGGPERKKSPSAEKQAIAVGEATASAPSSSAAERVAETTVSGRDIHDGSHGVGSGDTGANARRPDTLYKQAGVAIGVRAEACADDKGGSTTSVEQGKKRHVFFAASVDASLQPSASALPSSAQGLRTIDTCTPQAVPKVTFVAVETQTEGHPILRVAGVDKAVQCTPSRKPVCVGRGTQCGVATLELTSTGVQCEVEPRRVAVVSAGVQFSAGMAKQCSKEIQCPVSSTEGESGEVLSTTAVAETATANETTREEAAPDRACEASQDAALAQIATHKSDKPCGNTLDDDAFPTSAVLVESVATAPSSGPESSKSKNKRRKKKPTVRPSVLSEVFDKDAAGLNGGAASSRAFQKVCAPVTSVRLADNRTESGLLPRARGHNWVAFWSEVAQGRSRRWTFVQAVFFLCATSLALAGMWTRTDLTGPTEVEEYKQALPRTPSNANDSTDRRVQPPMWVVVGSSLTLGDVWAPRAEEGEEFEWFKDGQILPGRTSSFLTISAASLEDEGTYSCFSSAGKKQAKRTLLWDEATVRISEPPSVESQLQTQRLSRGEMLAIVATASGVPQPQYQWRRNGVRIPGANRPMLVRHSVTEADMGTYTCDVFNVAGSVQWEEMAVILREDSAQRDTRRNPVG